MNDNTNNRQINKKLGHTFFFILDLLCFWGLWIGYNDLIEVFTQIANQSETINFGSRDGFFTMGALIITIHVMIIIEHLFPGFVKKHMKTINRGGIIVLFIFIFSGFYISIWIKSKVEDEGYFYCRNASGVSALARTLVYTKDKDICEDLVESKRRRR